MEPKRNHHALESLDIDFDWQDTVEDEIKEVCVREGKCPDTVLEYVWASFEGGYTTDLLCMIMDPRPDKGLRDDEEEEEEEPGTIELAEYRRIQRRFYQKLAQQMELGRVRLGFFYDTEDQEQ